MPAAVLVMCLLTPGAFAESDTNSPVPYLQEVFVAAEKEYQAHPDNAETAWKYAHACFDRAEFPTNSAHRAQLARLGIEAARSAIARNSNSAAAHYYLAMNFGQLARTKSLGALSLVDKMEAEFKQARDLDESFDFAGPDRNLGRLYFEAPSFASIGSQTKAREHFDRAFELAPDYPENRLNLIESAVRWRQLGAARRELEALEKQLEQARKRFSGDAWRAAWIDWNARLEKVRSAVRKPGATRPARAK
jgi:tetratricopeptide (TPR) repeat protein